MNESDSRPPEHFEQHAGYAVYAPVGVVSIDVASELIARAISFARDHQIERLLVDATGFTGFSSPTVVDRYWIIRRMASAAKGRVAAALVLEAHLIDAERFGVTVAANSGFRADVFTSKTEALEWLLSSRAPRVGPVAGSNPDPGQPGGDAGHHDRPSDKK
jgi:hypothetical protein